MTGPEPAATDLDALPPASARGLPAGHDMVSTTTTWISPGIIPSEIPRSVSPRGTRWRSGQKRTPTRREASSRQCRSDPASGSVPWLPALGTERWTSRPAEASQGNVGAFPWTSTQSKRAARIVGPDGTQQPGAWWRLAPFPGLVYAHSRRSYKLLWVLYGTIRPPSVLRFLAVFGYYLRPCKPSRDAVRSRIPVDFQVSRQGLLGVWGARGHRFKSGRPD